MNLRFGLTCAWTQLALAAAALNCTVAHAIRMETSTFFLGQWDRLPAPLLITGSAIATVVLIRRARPGAAMTAALLPAAAHVLVTTQRLDETVPFGSWVRQALTLPLGQSSIQPYPALAEIGDQASMAAIVAGVAAAAVLAREARRRRPPGWAAVTILILAALAIVSSWAGGHVSELPGRGALAQPAVAALVAAAAAALIDAHTRWAARQGMPTVAAVSAAASGAVLLVPLGWLLWPLFRQWLGPPRNLSAFIIDGYGIPRWEGVAQALTALGSLLAVAAVALAALTAAHRATTIARRTNAD